MIVDQQLHGYRHGHELLSTTVRLPTEDQDLVDRLSDVAGPLAPNEKFLPYLTCYPLPSSSHFVFARTWQDLAAPRSGCVRTRSLLVRMADWMALDQPGLLAEASAEAGPNKPTERVDIRSALAKPLPPVGGAGTEVLEALFLEDRIPVAVFGAEMPEAMALRLLTALWPTYRSRFSVSTFCNSPRFIERKSFDLVFAPVGARSRFSDWKGRRVDGTRASGARHRWSAQITERVFRQAEPSLRGLDVLGEMASDDRGSEDALRVSLLWDELYQKVTSEPHAALGLLDIANTREAKNSDLVRMLEPALASAAATAVDAMPPNEAWRYLQTLTSKLGSSKVRLSVAKSLRHSAMELARRAPAEAVVEVPTLLEEGRRELLLGALGDGLANVPSMEMAGHLDRLAPTDLLSLLMASSPLADAVFRSDLGLDDRLGAEVENTDMETKRRASRLLRHRLVADRHAPLFRAFIRGMAPEGLVAELSRLHVQNDLGAGRLNLAIVEEAKMSNASWALRDLVVGYLPTPTTYAIIEALVELSTKDILWLLDDASADANLRRSLLLALIKRAPAETIAGAVSSPTVALAMIALIGKVDDTTAEALTKLAEHARMDPDVFFELVLALVPSLEDSRRSNLTARAFEVGLELDRGPSRNGDMEVLLLSAVESLNPARALRLGLSPSVEPALAGENIKIFDATPVAVRRAFLAQVEALVDAITARHWVDFSYEAAEAASRLMWDAGAVNRHSLVTASAKMLPFLMKQRHASASPLIAAAFPPVYEELKQDRLPELLALAFIFLDWDRCKIARRELADAFARSEWHATDIALAAARAGDAERIIRRLSNQSGGRDVLSDIEADLLAIPSPWQQMVARVLQTLRRE